MCIQRSMDRKTLINYAIYYSGEYKDILNAIKNNTKVENQCDVDAITIFDKEYPKKLFDLKYPPFVLFYKGDINLLKESAIGVVGSRNPCDYALKATEFLCKAKKDKIIVSGLAKGIDACAHLNAVKTIGVLGCGIDYIYPYCNYDLICNVKKEGLVLSEYPFMTKPLAYHFPFRNRIIVGLSDSLYVMQSKQKSGTMTSVNEALELGKDIHVLPYDIFNKDGVHNNQLIYDGANPILIDELVF